MASKIYFRQALTGGTADALDGIDGAVLADQDAALVITSEWSYIYHLNAESGQAESSPDIIAPDINAGDKRWIRKQSVLMDAQASALYNLQAEGGVLKLVEV